MKKQNKQAFPSTISSWDGDYIDHGMTLRDYFAAKAMNAYLDGEDAPIAFSMIAERAYEMADAMLKAR